MYPQIFRDVSLIPGIEYPISEVQDSIVIVDGVKGARYKAAATLILGDGSLMRGTVTKVAGTKAFVQIHGDSANLNIQTTRCLFPSGDMQGNWYNKDGIANSNSEPSRNYSYQYNHEEMIGVSEDQIGRVFNGRGAPLDSLPPYIPEEYLPLQGEPINPCQRNWPYKRIETGISAIDVMCPVAKGQTLPVFCDHGAPAREVAAQICRQAAVKEGDENFVIVFVALGVTDETANYYQKEFTESGVMSRLTLFIHRDSDSKIELLNTPHVALTYAEFLAFKRNKDVLVIISDLACYVAALIEVEGLSVKSEKSAWVYPHLAAIYDRVGRVVGSNGSLTQIPFLTMSNDGIGNQIPDRTGRLTDGQIILSRKIAWYPPIDILNSVSTLAGSAVEGPHNATRIRIHNDLATGFMNACDLVGNVDVGDAEKKYITFRDRIINEFLTQGSHERRSVEESYALGESLLTPWPTDEFGKRFPNNRPRIFKA